MNMPMTPERTFDANLWYVLKKLRTHALQANDPEHSPFLYLVQFDKAKNPPDAIPPKDEISLIKKLAKDYKVIDIGGASTEVIADLSDEEKIEEKERIEYAEEIISLYDIKASMMDNQNYTRPFSITIINPAFDELYKTQAEKMKDALPALLIKNVRLDERHLLLEINDGERNILFKSKKKANGLEREKKPFKILCHLWEFRRELKGNKVLQKGDYETLGNLATTSGCVSTGAAYKQIQRLNDRFKDEGVAIEIEGDNEKYRLLIRKA
jgi:hypothetical protein